MKKDIFEVHLSPSGKVITADDIATRVQNEIKENMKKIREAKILHQQRMEADISSFDIMNENCLPSPR